jgi:uncharacterized protein involved in exopolysaccharide biosynthesis
MSNQPQTFDDEIDLRDVIKTLIKQKVSIFIVFLLIFLAGFSYAFLVRPVYKAESIIKIGQISQPLLSQEEATRQLLSRDILSPVIKLDRGLTFRKVKEVLRVNGIKNTNLVEISFEDKDPEFAVRVLDIIGRRFIETNNVLYNSAIRLLDEEIEGLTLRKVNIAKEVQTLKAKEPSFSDSFLIWNTLMNYEQVYSGLEQRLYDLKSTRNFVQEFCFFELPFSSEIPVRPKKKLVLAVSGLLGLILGVFIAFIRETSQKTLRE